MYINENNKMTVSGEVVSDFKFSHKSCGEGFYLFDLKVDRKSDESDIVPILVSERILDVSVSAIGANIRVTGELRTHSKQIENKSLLIIFMFAKDIENIESDKFVYENEIVLRGFVGKDPKYRETPRGREVADVILAVNRKYRKSDYIPLLVWERDARFISIKEVGTEIEVVGRFQSREYRKKIGEDEFETRTAYEVSVSKMEVLERGSKN